MCACVRVCVCGAWDDGICVQCSARLTVLGMKRRGARGEGREQSLVGGLGGSLGRWVKALQRSWFGSLMEPDPIVR